MLKRNKTRICPKCHTPVYSHVKSCPECGTKLKKPFYLRWWFIAIVVVFVIGVISTISQNQAQKPIFHGCTPFRTGVPAAGRFAPL